MSFFTIASTSVTAVCAAGALAAAISANRISRRLHDWERERDSRLVEHDHRRRVEGIAAWIGLDPEDGNRPGIVISNPSELTVFDVVCGVRGFTSKAVQEQPIVPPGQYFVVPKGQTWEFPKAVSGMKTAPITATAAKKLAVTTLAFRDSSGRHWLRDEQNRLQLIEAEASRADA